MAAAQGNQYAAKDRMWSRAIKRALEKRSKSEALEELEAIAEKLLDSAKAGDMQAIKELGDRLDGKPKQIVGGDEDAPFKMLIGWMGQSK